MGEENHAAGQGSVASDPVTAPAEERLRRGRKRVRRAPSDPAPTDPVGPADDLATAAELAELESVVAALHEPDNLEALVSIPADVMLWRTGHQHWELSREEKDALTRPLAVVFRLWLRVHPKYMALALFGINALSVYGKKAMQERMLQLEEENRRLRQEKGQAA